MSASVSSTLPEGKERSELEAELSALVPSAQELRWIIEDASFEQHPAEAARLMAKRRAAGEPLQHVLSHWGFRNLRVRCDNRALVPRPETELVVEVALEAVREHSGELTVVELGTGSGVIAASLGLELGRRARIVATDLSPGAMSLAKENLEAALGKECLQASSGPWVSLLQGSWYEPLDSSLSSSVDLLIANPPYLAASEWDELDPVVRCYDPYMALVAGKAGTEALSAITSRAPEWLSSAGVLVVEIASSQEKEALSLAGAAGLTHREVRSDLAGRPRVLVARR
jgi:release factor glutamine methyltransferase